MRGTLIVIAVVGGALAGTACVRHRINVICPDDETLRSTIASQFSADTNMIVGRVVSIMLEPLAGSYVTLYPLGRQVETGEDGSFQFGSVPPGDYLLAVRRTGYGAVRERIRIQPNAGVQITATLGASVICITEAPHLSLRVVRRASPLLLANGR